MNYRKQKQPKRERLSVDRSKTVEQKNERRLLLLVTNGEKTEPNYFNGFKTLLPKGTLHPYYIEFQEGNQLQVVATAIAKNSDSKYDEVWVVLDTEDLDKEGNCFRKAITLAQNNNISVAYSNRQIEVWFLFFFQQGREACNKMGGNKTISKLEDCLHAIGISDKYQKSHSIFNTLLHHGNEQAAIEHADNVLAQAEKNFPNEPWKCNPSTTVHTLVKKLREMADEYNNN